MSKACLVTSLGMLGMSEGLHANISTLARRKSTSTASYLMSRVVLSRLTVPSSSSPVLGIPSPTWKHSRVGS
jgi:hypothetical protein